MNYSQELPDCQQTTAGMAIEIDVIKVQIPTGNHSAFTTARPAVRIGAQLNSHFIPTALLIVRKKAEHFSPESQKASKTLTFHEVVL